MLLEYQLDGIKIVDFLLIAKFLASTIIFDSPSNPQTKKKTKFREKYQCAFGPLPRRRSLFLGKNWPLCNKRGMKLGSEAHASMPHAQCLSLIIPRFEF